MAQILKQPTPLVPHPEEALIRYETNEEEGQLSINTKIIITLFSVAPLAYSGLFAFHYIGGGFLYYYEYLAAVHGREPAPIYSRIKVTKTLGDEVNWFQIQRCLGNDLGLTRRGDTWTVLRDIIQELFSPTAAPGFVMVS